MEHFSIMLSLQEPTIIKFLRNNYIEEILNNVECNFDETITNLFSPLQRLLFIITIKTELLSMGMRIYSNEKIKNNNLDIEKEKIIRFFKNKLNILTIFYENNSKYPEDQIIEYALK